MRWILWGTAALWIAAGSASAQVDPGTYETILLPVATEPFAGAHGAYWVTEYTLLNSGATGLRTESSASDRTDIFPFKFFGYPFPGGGFTPLEPGEASSRAMFLSTGSLPGTLVHVRRSRAADLHFSLRVRDVSQSLETWGTEIPVVRESDLLRGEIHLLDIPIHENYRQALRIYDPLARIKDPVTLKILSMETGEVLTEVMVPLVQPAQQPTRGCQLEERCFPAQTEIVNLSAAFPQIRTTGRIRVHLSNAAGEPFWALVSVTNNTTQEITTIQPQ